jgi:hypothetical protein
MVYNCSRTIKIISIVKYCTVIYIHRAGDITATDIVTKNRAVINIHHTNGAYDATESCIRPADKSVNNAVKYVHRRIGVVTLYSIRSPCAAANTFNNTAINANITTTNINSICDNTVSTIATCYSTLNLQRPDSDIVFSDIYANYICTR